MNRMMMVAILSCIALSTRATCAQPIAAFTFTGHVDTIVDANNFLGGMFQLGDPLQGSFSYDLSVTDENPTSEFGEYPQTSLAAEISFTVNGFTFRTVAPLRLTVRNNEISPVDNFIFIGNTLGSVSIPPVFDLGGSAAVDFQLADNLGTAIASDQLPSDLILANWTNSATIEVVQSTPDTNAHFRIVGAIDTLRLVPEPNSIGLLASALLLIVSSRRRRARA